MKHMAVDGRVMNAELRMKIVETVFAGKHGHIPSAFSIIDVLEVLYRDHLKFDPKNPDWPDRDYFILSKGHGCVAQYVLLERYGIISQKDLDLFCQSGGILGEHADATRVPSIEASTGSLGHGFPFALGHALGLRLQGRENRVWTLLGDGECNEGTIWESALVAAKLQLGNICAIVDFNGSAATILPVDPLRAKWDAFGWETYEIDGHSEEEIQGAMSSIKFTPVGKPKMIVSNTLKGKGVPMMEGHGIWHSRVPTLEEMDDIREVLF
jgi:transketolase